LEKRSELEIYVLEFSICMWCDKAQEVIQRERRAEKMGIENESKEISPATQDYK